MKLNGRSVIENSIESMFNAQVNEIVVVLGYRAMEIEALLNRRYSGERMRLAYNPTYSTTDMLYSAKLGLSVMSACDAFYLLPGDMPAIDSSTFFAVSAAMESSKAKLAFPTLEGRKKHPPLIAKDCIASILSFQEEGGLRKLWQRYEEDTVTVAVDDRGCLIDTDTPEDYIRCVNYMEGFGNR